MPAKTRIFIAHAEEDGGLARKVKDVLAHHLACQSDAIFLSSDGAITPDQEFPAAIKANVIESSAVLVLLTPTSMWRPWLHFESGGAYFSKNKFLFVACANGIQPNALPSNLLFHSVVNLAEPNGVHRLIASLNQALQFESTVPVDLDRIKEVCSLAAKGASGWNLVRAAMVSSKTSGSPFQLTDLLDEATQHVFVAGQNLYSMTLGPASGKIKKAIFDDFLSRKNTVVRILLQDPDYDHGVEVWNSLMGDFGGDLTKSVEKFRGWLKDARDEGINKSEEPEDRRLDIRVTTLVPGTFNFADPDEPYGKMICNFVLRRAPQSELRPVMCLTGGVKNEVITYYWNIWKIAFDEATPLL